MKRTMIGMFAVMFAMGCDSAPTDSTDPSLAAGSTKGGWNGKLTCFSDGGAACTTSATSATLTVGAGQYAGVYYKNTAVGNTPIGDVAALSFAYTGGPLAGGSPRFSIPIDETAGATDAPAYAFISNGCALNVVDAMVCEVNYKAQTHTGWAAFAAALGNENFVLSNDVPFVIVDQPGNFVISKVVIALKK
jgi:hypothetical protein